MKLIISAVALISNLVVLSKDQQVQSAISRMSNLANSIACFFERKEKRMHKPFMFCNTCGQNFEEDTNNCIYCNSTDLVEEGFGYYDESAELED